MTEPEHLGKLLRQAREKLGLTQENFALALGLKLSRLQKWERGASEPRFTVMEWRRFRSLNPEVYEALMSGALGSLRMTSMPRRSGRGSQLRRTDIDPPDDPAEDETYLLSVA